MSTRHTSPRTPRPARTARLVDRFGRTHHDLRVSLTDRCNLRCTYCMPAEGLDWMATPDLLTADEIVRVVRIATDLGITEVRLTGGEPLIRPDVVDIVARLAALPRAPHLSVTTNGLRLAALAAPLAEAGLSRVNISCDTLSRETFAAPDPARPPRRRPGRDRRSARGRAGPDQGQHRPDARGQRPRGRRRCCAGPWTRG